ncbi:hypothetical protein BLA39750_02394 [Burkholderia lata]|uniref:Uncharacterized protein n=1 Tax=Burkholderia lata (strain ATCC 17760 / DSM 23089 / LMG 22485 / NCIMB 9086 / R18194 / 383) TaxID=482957 RepID=A0A6P2WNI6_BURL3|nr:hypothetical protein BLA39750_02394 [Burkholderia lata]
MSLESAFTAYRHPVTRPRHALAPKHADDESPGTRRTRCRRPRTVRHHLSRRGGSFSTPLAILRACGKSLPNQVMSTTDIRRAAFICGSERYPFLARRALRRCFEWVACRIRTERPAGCGMDGSLYAWAPRGEGCRVGARAGPQRAMAWGAVSYAGAADERAACVPGGHACAATRLTASRRAPSATPPSARSNHARDDDVVPTSDSGS